MTIASAPEADFHPPRLGSPVIGPVLVSASSGGGKSSRSVQRLGLVSSKLEAVGTWCRREVAGPALENRHTVAVQVVIEVDDLFTVWPSTVT